jgi:hypothetical protein
MLVEEFTKAVRKRKLDAAGKNLGKCPKVAGKKKMEAPKVAPSWAKASLKRQSPAEVASARPLKQSKKTMAHLAVAATTTCVPARALSSKVVAGASDSKGVPNVKKMAMPIRKHRVPAIGAMVSSKVFFEEPLCIFWVASFFIGGLFMSPFTFFGVASFFHRRSF